MALVASGDLGGTGEVAGSWWASVQDFIPPGTEEVFGLSRWEDGAAEEGWRERGCGGAQPNPLGIHRLLSSVMLHSPATRNRRVGAESTATATNLSYLLDEIVFKGCHVKRSNLFYKPSKARGASGKLWTRLAELAPFIADGAPTKRLRRHMLV